MTIDTTNMCSHLQKKLFEPDGVYYPIWQAMQDDAPHPGAGEGSAG